MSSMSGHISQPALRRLQLRMRPMLRPIGGFHQAGQGTCSGDVGGDSPLQAEPASIRDSWFAERARLGTRLSEAELQHGVKAGLISATLLS